MGLQEKLENPCRSNKGKFAQCLWQTQVALLNRDFRSQNIPKAIQQHMGRQEGPARQGPYSPSQNQDALPTPMSLPPEPGHSPNTDVPPEPPLPTWYPPTSGSCTNPTQPKTTESPERPTPGSLLLANAYPRSPCRHGSAQTTAMRKSCQRTPVLCGDTSFSQAK